jgi:CheY-like chemotaxis protein
MPGRRTAKILMVDDRPENLLALEAILQGLGHELIKASSGEEALKCLLTTEVAVLLLDVQMPGMDGFETAAHVKGREKTRDIPILFLTAIDGEAHQAFRGYAAGGVDFLAKPFDPWVLKAKVGVFVDLSVRRLALTAEADRLRRQLARYQSAGLEELSEQACEAAEQALKLHENGDPGLADALERTASATQVLRQALPGPAPAVAGIFR